MTPFPSGTVTFAFTDVEGSTRRWDRHREAMRDAMRRHDDLVSAAILAYGGRVFKTVGDAFCAAFARAEDAIGAMLAAQRALAAEDFLAVEGIRVRAAVGTGSADERNGDYFGPAVNRVARLLAIGHGGQVLASGVTSELVQDALPPYVTLRDLGLHLLKDFARPERVYQLVAPGLETHFPPLNSENAPRNNLPHQMTSFIGREAEVAQILAMLRANRLVTLVGSGGIGKTRASLQVGVKLVDAYADGVWFIELAPLSSGDYIASTVAQTMNIALLGEADPLRLLVLALQSKRALLIFDNCEHLVEPAGRAIGALLRDTPEINVLASTRQRLGIAGEMTYRMPSLRVTEAGVSLTAAQAMSVPAIALFVARASAADDRFALNEDNASLAGDICRRLDGIPLAIELAAARIGMLNLRQIRDRLAERFRLLVGGGSDVLARHQTLRALVDWSYELLDERERALLRRLAVFANGFTVEGASAVAGGERRDEYDVFQTLASLVDKSLVLSEASGEERRFRMLESTRAYAGEALAAAGELEASLVLHLRYLRDLFVTAKSQADRSGRKSNIEALFIGELDDVRAALDGIAAELEPELAAELLVALETDWSLIGLEAEGFARIERFIELLQPCRRRLISRLWNVLAMLANFINHSRALEAAHAAVALAREANDPEAQTLALTTFAHLSARSRDFEAAERALCEAETLVTGTEVLLRLRMMKTRAFLSYMLGDLDAAAELYLELGKRHSDLGNVFEATQSAMDIAENQHGRGQTENAVATLTEVLPALRNGSDRNKLLLALANLASYHVALDRLANALSIVREALLRSDDCNRVSVTLAIEAAALAIALAGYESRGARLAGYTEAALTRSGVRREYTEQTTRTRLEALLHDRLTPDEQISLLAAGAALSPSQVVALLLDGASD